MPVGRMVYPLIDDLRIKRRADAPPVGDNQSAALHAAISNQPAPLDKLDPPNLPRISKLHIGYPWKASNFRLRIIDPYRSKYNSIHLASAIGVRWQSIIVSPTKLPWMTPAPVGNNPRFAWWRRLREVDCSWLASCGESERFLYYDGPTSRKAPVSAVLDHLRRLRLTSIPSERSAARPGLYLHVMPDRIAAAWIDDVAKTPALDVSNLPSQPRDDVFAEFAGKLAARGLTPHEASALADCWKEAFFTRPGRRFLAFMTIADYDAACPMRIRPAPTQIVRLGILWTEF